MHETKKVIPISPFCLLPITQISRIHQLPKLNVKIAREVEISNQYNLCHCTLYSFLDQTSLSVSLSALSPHPATPLSPPPPPWQGGWGWGVQHSIITRLWQDSICGCYSISKRQGSEWVMRWIIIFASQTVSISGWSQNTWNQASW